MSMVQRIMIMLLPCASAVSNVVAEEYGHYGRLDPPSLGGFNELEGYSAVAAADPPPAIAAAMGDSDPVVISNGFVIVEDELLERPYVIWRNGNGIKINGRLVWRREPVRVWAFRDNPPDVPDAAPSDHDDWDEWLYRNWDEYWRQCLEYVFAHADRPYALPSEVAPLLERLPCFRRVWVWEPEPGCAPEETYLRVEWNGGNRGIDGMETLDICSTTQKHFRDQRAALRFYDLVLGKLTDALRRGDVVNVVTWYDQRVAGIIDIDNMRTTLGLLGEMANGTMSMTNGIAWLRKDPYVRVDDYLAHLDSYRWIVPGVVPHWLHSRTDVHRRVLTDGNVVTNGVRAALPLELTADRDGVHLGDLTLDRRYEGTDIDEDELPERYLSVLDRICEAAWEGCVVVSGTSDQAEASWADMRSLEILQKAWHHPDAANRPETVFQRAASAMGKNNGRLACPEHLLILTKEEVDRMLEDLNGHSPAESRRDKGYFMDDWFPRPSRSPYEILFP